MPESAENAKVIIALLESAKKDADKRDIKQGETNDHLHECIHSVDENIRGIKSYFIGIDPQKHIIHHIRMEETVEMNNGIKKAIWGSVVSVFFTGLMAFMQWTAVNAQRDMQLQVTDIIKNQAQLQAQTPGHVTPRTK